MGETLVARKPLIQPKVLKNEEELCLKKGISLSFSYIVFSLLHTENH